MIVPIDTQVHLLEELERVSKPGTSVFEQATVISWAAGFANAYFYTRKGALRRVFPKDKCAILFAGVPKTDAAGKDTTNAGQS